MKETIDNLYISNPESSDSFISEILSEHSPLTLSQYIDISLENNQPSSIIDEVDESVSNLNQNSINTKSKKVNKSTSTILKLSATLVGSTVGVLALINPLITRPSIKNSNFVLKENVLNYKFELSARTVYSCYLILNSEEKEIEKIKLENNGVIEGFFTLNDHGNYNIRSYFTNNFDFNKTTTLYEFTF